MDLLQAVKKTVYEHHLLEPGDSVLVALSGGPDSVALLHLLYRLRTEYRLALQAVYINHQIRKRAALQEEQFCRKLCARLKIPLEIVREDVPRLAKAQKKGIEEAARDFRYVVFDQLTLQYGHDKIALGHHVNDRVETLLFRIIRGTGRTGLVGMPVKRGKIIRPLFDITRERILEYLKRHRLSYCVDQSNLRSDYSRNFIRNKLIPQINSRLNPQFERVLLNLSETLSGEEQHLAETAAQAIERVTRPTATGKIELDVPAFSAYTTWLRRRVLRYCLGSSSGRSAGDRETIDRLDKFIRSDAKSHSLPGKIEAVRAGDKVVFRHGHPPSFEADLELNGRVHVPSLGLTVRCRTGRRPAGAASRTPRSKKVLLDWDKVVPPLTVRSIRAGDRFQPLGLGGSKKIGDYLTDRKVPKIYRDEIPVVTDRHGIIWLVGYEIADRVKVAAATRKVVILEAVTEKGRQSQAV